jgi:hypothetical protein
MTSPDAATPRPLIADSPVLGELAADQAATVGFVAGLGADSARRYAEFYSGRLTVSGALKA